MATIEGRTFSQRVRELMARSGMSISELAERAELAQSLISKLLTDTATARRNPRLEHVLAIARTLEVTPAELVAGTDAEGLLGDWVPRSELEAESKERSKAQAEAARLKTELAGVRSEASALQHMSDQLSQEVTELMKKLADAEATAKKHALALRVTQDKARSQIAAAEIERDRALDLAQQNYLAWTNARSQILQLQRAVADAKGSAAAGWFAALVGTMGGAILGASAADPGKKTASERKQPRRKKRTKQS